MRRVSRVVVLALLGAARPVFAQGEDQLRDAFEGRMVTVKLDMPATSKGVNIRPQERRALDLHEYADRLKDYGTALRAGTPVMVTKVRVKKDLIEFQLGGGGYGTFGDEQGDVYVSTEGKSTREKNLERDLKNEKDPARRRAMQEELDRLRKERNTHNALVEATNAAAEAANKSRVREKAIAAGSRFNIRFEPVIPAEAMTPEGLRSALAAYVDFAPLVANGQLPAGPPVVPVTNLTEAQPGIGAAPARPSALRKGLTQTEVEAMLGRPVSLVPRSEGTLKVLKATYSQGESEIVAEFVEGVLIRYSISSK